MVPRPPPPLGQEGTPATFCTVSTTMTVLLPGLCRGGEGRDAGVAAVAQPGTGSWALGRVRAGGGRNLGHRCNTPTP